MSTFTNSFLRGRTVAHHSTIPNFSLETNYVHWNQTTIKNRSIRKLYKFFWSYIRYRLTDKCKRVQIPTLLAFYPVIGQDDAVQAEAVDGIAGGPMDLRVLGQPGEAPNPRKRRWAIDIRRRKEAKWRRRLKTIIFWNFELQYWFHAWEEQKKQPNLFLTVII